MSRVGTRLALVDSAAGRLRCGRPHQLRRAPENGSVSRSRLAYWMFADMVTQPELVQIEHVDPVR